jgi:MOSC domain-containing protein YiiM
MAAFTDPSRRPHGSFIESVNVGSIRIVEWRGDRVATGIWKSPVAGRVPVQGVNVVGDDQAVYVYGREDYDWWARQLGHELGPGTFGENLTVRGVSVSEAVIGERWRMGTVLLEVSQPRLPCYKLGIRMNDARFPRRFAAAGRPGTYLRIVERGELGAGDSIEVVHRPTHGLTIGDVAHIYLNDRSRVDRLLEVPELPAEWQDWARSRRLARR